MTLAGILLLGGLVLIADYAGRRNYCNRRGYFNSFGNAYEKYIKLCRRSGIETERAKKKSATLEIFRRL